ncbi:MAG: cobalamin-dependent protein [Candidatus Aminicenantes bacterium]|nr:cobalamin-dependent protein [Candidatus Aminicenantes bacterium]
MGKLSDAMASLDKQGVIAAVEEGIKSGRDPIDMIEEAREGLEKAGQEFENGNFFLMELMRAAQIFKAAAALLDPVIKECHGDTKAKGTVLIGTVAGDVHDLGKGIVATLLQCGGFEVIDLGVDVAEDVFVRQIREKAPQVVGMSGLLTTSIPVMKKTVDAISAAGLRDKVKVIVGGGVVGEVNTSSLGVDHATSNASEGIRVIEDWIEESGL